MDKTVERNRLVNLVISVSFHRQSCSFYVLCNRYVLIILGRDFFASIVSLDFIGNT